MCLPFMLHICLQGVFIGAQNTIESPYIDMLHLSHPYRSKFNDILNRTFQAIRKEATNAKRSYNAKLGLNKQSNAQCENLHKYSIFGNYLKVNRNDPMKTELLKEFLCVKFFQYFDTINYLSMGEYRHSLYEFKIFQFNSELLNNGKHRTSNKHGIDKCDLENVALNNYDENVSVCPWHWIVIEREELYPFKLPVAKCNCANCQAKTKYDTDMKSISGCNTNYALKPVLARLTDVPDLSNTEEIWVFNLEEVPVSCSCSVRIKTY